ncbi:tetratricopeptide repeat protein [Herbaspirillum sp. alder98]|uniref:tetratricopeptide repeat protein n=1 Tax=Herbaspirillum sp. alder98 TaxID=2913096 RepID=UPI001CD8DF94|nr:tetratricopeptide repeat protein [Herbaspirillum sp. alder98]MCA1322578.1 tetratricopeptide repeat protein [Herbaspirillum sp. alder98]
MSTRKKSNAKTTKPAAPTRNLQDLLDVRASLDLLDDRKIDQAKALCDAVLKRAPNLVFAHNARGLIAMHELEYPLAERFLRRAVELDPGNAEYITTLGTIVLKQDRIDESIKLYEEAISIDRDSREARVGLANALHEKNDPDASIAYFEDAARREPEAPGPLSHLGRALTDAKRFNEAVAVILKSLELQISFAPAHTALGETFHAMELYKEALESLKTSILLDPKDVYTHSKIADTYLKLKQVEQANEHYQRIIEIAPKDPNSYAKLAVSIAENQQRTEEAMVLFKKALEIDPRHALTYNNIGAVMHEDGKSLEALDYFEKALEIQPTYATARHNLALGQLLHGRMQQGWENHESRLIVRERTHVYRMIHKLFEIIPKWDGKSSLAGKYILLMHEQGFGDSIQFVRYARLLQERGARIALHVKNPLYRLFQSFSKDITLVRETDPLPSCDCAYVLMSLPHALGSDTVDDIPSYPSYLSAAPGDLKKWQSRLAELAPDGRRLKVGFVWGGNPEHANDKRRSIPLTELQPLFALPGIDFISLQKGKPTQDLATLPPGTPVINMGEEFGDFADTAAAIANLDLVISVDTSVVHLAGALGGRTWTLLAHIPDWRWLMDREDSPWYPNMRLFRQPVAHDWKPVIQKMAIELTALRDGKIDNA